jgi:hypothetical protein
VSVYYTVYTLYYGEVPMTKVSGLGDNFYVGGYDLSGDISAIGQLGGGPATLDVTPINAYANVRIGGLVDGDWQFTSFFDAAAGEEHPALSSLPTADTIGTYMRGTTLQNPGACINAKQLNYDPTRDATGNLTLAVELQANGYGMEWGEQLTAGLRTDTTATTSSAITDTAATNYGAQAYLQLVAFTGTSVTVTIEHATSSGGSYSSLIAFNSMTGIGAQRATVANTTTVDQYLKVATTGTFTLATFAVVFVRNQIAGVQV